MRLVILGPPGAGKGTQSARLARTFSILHLSTGDMLRAAIAAGTEIGRAAKETIDAGRFMPDDVMTAIVLDRIAQPDARAGFILDGFPRTQAQAIALHAALSERAMPLDTVIELVVDETALVSRIEARAHEARARGETPRADDDPKVLATRLEIYRDLTAPVSRFYERAGLLVRIDGMQSIDDVTVRILGSLAVRPPHDRDWETTLVG